MSRPRPHRYASKLACEASRAGVDNFLQYTFFIFYGIIAKKLEVQKIRKRKIKNKIKIPPF